MIPAAGGEGRPAAVHPLWHLVPAVFVGGLLFLGVRSLVVDDARFGWGMFKEYIFVDVDYAWVMRDGTLRPHWPGAEARGLAYRVDGQPGRIHGYGRGGMHRWIGGYLSWRARRDPPPGAVALRAVAEWKVNRSGPSGRDVLEEPVRP